MGSLKKLSETTAYRKGGGEGQKNEGWREAGWGERERSEH